MIKYMIVEGDAHLRLAFMDVVNHGISIGWIPLGGVSAYNGKLLQAMTKEIK